MLFGTTDIGSIDAALYALLAAEMLTGSDGEKDTTIRGLEMGSVPPRSANTLLCAAVTLAEATRVSEPTTSQPSTSGSLVASGRGAWVVHCASDQSDQVVVRRQAASRGAYSQVPASCPWLS